MASFETMPRVPFTSNLQRHADCAEREVAAATVSEALQKVFEVNPAMRGYIVDESGDALAMGSTAGGLWISEDGGDAWACVSGNLPPVYGVRFG